MARHGNSCSGGGGCKTLESEYCPMLEFSETKGSCLAFVSGNWPAIQTSSRIKLPVYLSFMSGGKACLGWQSYGCRNPSHTWTIPDSGPSPYHIREDITLGSTIPIAGYDLEVQTGRCSGSLVSFKPSMRYAKCIEYYPTCSNSCWIEDLEIKVGETKAIPYSGSLSSVSNDIIFMSGANVTALKPGTVNITVRTSGCCSTSAVATVTVTGEYQVLSATIGDLIVGLLTQIFIESKSESGESTGLTEFTMTASSEFVEVVGTSILCSKFGVYAIQINQLGTDYWMPASLTLTVVCFINNLNPSLIASGGSDYVKDILLTLLVIRVCMYTHVSSFILYGKL